MNRRFFLFSAAAAAVAPALPKMAEPFVAQYTHNTAALGFSVESVQTVGLMRPTVGGMMMRADFAQELADQLNKIFFEEYANHGAAGHSSSPESD